MPIYEYRCDACGYEFEVIQKMSDDLLTVCEACTEPELRKKISAVAFRLKGSGWYETDFKADNKRQLHEDSTSKSEDSSSDTSESAGANGKDTAKDDSASAKTDDKKPAETKSNSADNAKTKRSESTASS